MAFGNIVTIFLRNGQKYKYFCFISLKIWSHRLTVRTPGSHPGNWSSILHGITKIEFHSAPAEFYFTQKQLLICTPAASMR